MKILINYANKPYRQTQKWNSWMGRHIGGFDKVYSFSPEDIQREYFENHREILSNPRGNGLWLWKPYFILRVLEQCREGDLVFYADSGSFFLRGIDHLINGMAEGEDIWVSDIPLLEGSFTAPVCMEKLNCDTERIRNSNQIQGGFLLLRCSRESREFVRRWLALCEDRDSRLEYVRIGRYTTLGPDVKVVTGQHPTHTIASTYPAFYSAQGQMGFTYTDRTIFQEVR